MTIEHFLGEWGSYLAVAVLVRLYVGVAWEFMDILGGKDD